MGHSHDFPHSRSLSVSPSVCLSCVCNQVISSTDGHIVLKFEYWRMSYKSNCLAELGQLNGLINLSNLSPLGVDYWTNGHLLNTIGNCFCLLIARMKVNNAKLKEMFETRWIDLTLLRQRWLRVRVMGRECQWSGFGPL